MEKIKIAEIESKIEYLQHILSKLEHEIVRLQLERVDVKYKLEFLHHLHHRVEHQKAELAS